LTIDTKNVGATETYMTRVHTFVHYLGLAKDIDIAGDEYFFAEKEIDWIIRDIPNLGGAKRPLNEKVAKIVGVLKAVRSGFHSKAGLA
jgi:hypothetical protein